MTPDPDAARGDDGEPEPRGEDGEPERSGAQDAPATGGDAAAGDHAEQPPHGPLRREPALPANEEAAWAAIVAGYGREPDAGTSAADDDSGPAGSDTGSATGPEGAGLIRPVPEPEGRDGDTPVRSFTVYSAGTGPRDSRIHSEDDGDEGHFVPPEPPPLPETDPTTRFAWLAALGGPLLLFACILTGTAMTWWLYTLGIGGFLGGFATLVARMRDDDEGDGDDPGRGAVV